jgi:DNA adenine methylase
MDGQNQKQLINGKFPCPFVKWAGGKRFLINELISRLPARFNNYYEPFAGGGALFFAIYQKFTGQAYLSDINLDLVFAYRAIQDDPRRLITILKNHAENHTREHYYEVRTSEPEEAIDRAARFIYLNKTCYNGLYRVNKSGKFNVPLGTQKNSSIVQESNILRCHEALKCAQVEYKEFDKITPKPGDFAYCDPPYHPTDAVSFTGYTKMNFTERDQERLMEFAISLHRKGVFVMLSNSDTPYINDLYKGEPFKISIVNAPRFVNCKADKRNPVREVLITNY